MSRGKRSVRAEFIFGAIFVFIIILALVLDWWKTHAAIGWTIIGVIVVVFAYSLYRFPNFRSWVFRKGKSASEKVVFEEGAPKREQIPSKLYRIIMSRANYHCENPSCRYSGKPQIHHINMDKNDSSLGNLIALCPNCHADAHHGKLTYSQIKNFARYSFGRRE